MLEGGGWVGGVGGSVLGRQHSLTSSWLEEPESGGTADVGLEVTEGIAEHHVCFSTSPGGKRRPLIWLRAKQLAFVLGDENQRCQKEGRQNEREREGGIRQPNVA